MSDALQRFWEKDLDIACRAGDAGLSLTLSRLSPGYLAVIDVEWPGSATRTMQAMGQTPNDAVSKALDKLGAS